MNPGPTKVLIVDDHPLLRLGARAYLEADGQFNVVGDADNAEDALELASLHEPDVILLDIRLKGGTSGIALGKEVRTRVPLVKLLVLTNFYHEPYIRAMLEVGVEGFLLKDTPPSEIADAIRMIVSGRTVFSSRVTEKMVGGYLSSRTGAGGAAVERLTPKEVEVLNLMTAEGSTQHMADRLGISTKGVQQHLTGIYSKLGVQNRAEAIVKAAREGIIVLDEPSDLEPSE